MWDLKTPRYDLCWQRCQCNVRNSTIFRSCKFPSPVQFYFARLLYKRISFGRDRSRSSSQPIWTVAKAECVQCFSGDGNADARLVEDQCDLRARLCWCGSICYRRSDQLDYSVSKRLFSKDRAGLLSKCIQSKSLDLAGGRVHLP